MMNCSAILNPRLSNGVNFQGLIQTRWGSLTSVMNISINQTITIIKIQGGYDCQLYVTLLIPNIGLSLPITITSSYFF